MATAEEQTMEHRPLGRTGVSVSKLCLGAMMFGDWDNKDHDSMAVGWVGTTLAFQADGC
jgi:aryl-alcohol dehydrogenase-like predicted oxidoreductase